MSCQVSCVMCQVPSVWCHMAGVMYQVSHVTCHMSLTSAATAIDPPPTSSPIIPRKVALMKVKKKITEKDQYLQPNRTLECQLYSQS